MEDVVEDPLQYNIPQLDEQADDDNQVHKTCSSCSSSESIDDRNLEEDSNNQGCSNSDFEVVPHISSWVNHTTIIHSDILTKILEYMNDKSPPVLRNSWSDPSNGKRIQLRDRHSTYSEGDNNLIEPPRRSQTIWYTDQILTEEPAEIIYHKNRFWILIIYSLLLLYQNLAWSTWGPLSKTAKYAFHWKEYVTAELAGWSPVTFTIFVVPVTWIMEHWGVRWPMIICTCAGVLGRVLCCIDMNPDVFNLLVQFGAVLTGVMGTLVVAIIAIPAMWFPSQQKMTATAVPVMMSQIGTWISYLTPLVISKPKNATRDKIRDEIQILMIVELAVVVSLLVAVVVYFPSRPKNHTTASSESHLHHRDIFKILASRWGFWGIVTSYGIFTGVARSWIYVAASALHQMGIKQIELVWLGGSMIVILILMTLIVGRIVDKRRHGVRNSLLVLVIVCTLAYLWLILLTGNAIPFTNVQLYIAMIVSQCSNLASIPLFYEWASSVGQPCSETIVGAFLACANNLVTTLSSFCFFFIGIDIDDVQWITYVLLGSCLAPLPTLVFLHQDPINPNQHIQHFQETQSASTDHSSTSIDSISDDVFLNSNVENYI